MEVNNTLIAWKGMRNVALANAKEQHYRKMCKWVESDQWKDDHVNYGNHVITDPDDHRSRLPKAIWTSVTTARKGERRYDNCDEATEELTSCCSCRDTFYCSKNCQVYYIWLILS